MAIRYFLSTIVVIAMFMVSVPIAAIIAFTLMVMVPIVMIFFCIEEANRNRQFYRYPRRPRHKRGRDESPETKR